jgi:Arc/MetJ family transcription regulator
MRTTINIDDTLYEKIQTLVDGSTKTEIINRALAEFVRLRAKDELLGLRGQLELEEDWQRLRDGEGRHDG